MKRSVVLIALITGVPSAMADADALRVEISADGETRERIYGHLVDLPIRVEEEARGEAPPVAELLDGVAELCVFVRIDQEESQTVLRLGLIDRRARRRLVERRTLNEGQRSVALELAALTVREWVSDVLRGGELGVSIAEPDTTPDMRAEPVTRPPEPTPEQRAPQGHSPRLGWHIEAGWLVGFDGAASPMHGPRVGGGFGRGHWAMQVTATYGLANEWALDGVEIERRHFSMRWSAELAAHFAAFSLRGSLATGPAWSWRRTLRVRAGLRPTPNESHFSWLVVAQAAAGVTIGQWALLLRVGAELWLRRPAYRVAETRSPPWPLRPVASLGIRYEWPPESEDPQEAMTAFDPGAPLYW